MPRKNTRSDAAYCTHAPSSGVRVQLSALNPNTNEATELQRQPRRTIFSPHGSHVVKVAVVRVSEQRGSVIFLQPVAPRPERERSHTLVLFLCCASLPPAKQTQQKQSLGQAHVQAPSFQIRPTATSMSTTPPVPATSTAMLRTATAQPRPLLLRACFVIFLSPSHQPSVTLQHGELNPRVKTAKSFSQVNRRGSIRGAHAWKSRMYPRDRSRAINTSKNDPVKWA
ncbi:hypothetical protein BDR03DRAFT_953891 [Suillus americanus]|nr:hypothetical protein BDR03DRAFT_953891 [Suillus americanus]